MAAGKLSALTSDTDGNSTPIASNLTWHSSTLGFQERANLRAKFSPYCSSLTGFTLWFTGLSGAGKSTLATALERHFIQHGLPAYRLDGDNIRFGLNRDLGFSPQDRHENIRRVGEVAKLFADSGTIALVACISPYRKDRQTARQIHQTPWSQNASSDNTAITSAIPFVEVFVDVPLNEAISRDPKGLYARALAGEIPQLTGMSKDAPYEPPDSAEIHVATHQLDIPTALQSILTYLHNHELIPNQVAVLKNIEKSSV